MKMMGDLFSGVLSKYGGKVIDGDVYIEFVITHTSKNEPEQEFLNSFDEEFSTNLSSHFRNPLWNSIKFPTSKDFTVKFDQMDKFNATLSELKVSQKEKNDEVVFKYDLVFFKRQKKDIDDVLASYLKHKEENEDGKNVLVEYDVELS